MGLVEKRTAPTRDWVLETGSVPTMVLMKLSISLKLPRPWYSMLPEPSIKKPKSTTVLHTGGGGAGGGCLLKHLFAAFMICFRFSATLYT